VISLLDVVLFVLSYLEYAVALWVPWWWVALAMLNLTTAALHTLLSRYSRFCVLSIEE
jgi:ABC-type multidrug transport system permease subunit